MENKKTELAELGEFGLIKKITKNFKISNSSTVKGVGDDAAVLNYGNKKQVVTTDLLVEGIHFNLMYAPLKHLGYKAVAVNLSDVYAMNATPKQITVSIAVSNRFPLEAIEELYSGIQVACEKYNVDLIGGDTSSSMSGLIISITAMGEADEEKITYRNTAKPDDLLCVSGDLGAAYAGLQLLEREKELYKANPKLQPELTGNDYILQRQLKPEPRREIIEILAKENIQPSSMIDISDGLSSEIFHLCTQSKVGCSIYQDKVPLAEETKNFAKEINMEPLVFALNGGEDYELLFTVPQSDFQKVKAIPEISIIGHMSDAPENIFMVTSAGAAIALEAQGWTAMSV